MQISFSQEIQLRVRYSETDQMGFCYYGHYASFLESARVETLRSLGISYRKIEEGGILLPVTSLQIDYKKPLRYDELFSIHTKLVSLSACTVTFDYVFYNQAKEITTTASTTLVFTDAKSLRPIRIPNNIIDTLRAYEIAEK